MMTTPCHAGCPEGPHRHHLKRIENIGQPVGEFQLWMTQVNRLIGKIGLSVDDLPDIDYWGLWENDKTPENAAAAALLSAGADPLLVEIFQAVETGR